MCQFCIKHGEGKKWYLNAKNYSDELVFKHLNIISDVVETVDNVVPQNLRVFNAMQKIPFVNEIFRRLIKRAIYNWHFGQVIPYEDIEKIFKFTKSIVRFHCACRKILLGKDNERYCFGVGLGAFPDAVLGSYPDAARELERFEPDQALKLIREFGINGNLHTVWTFGMPFTGVICNCNLQDCLPMRHIKYYGAEIMIKAEYFAEVDIDKCSGCRECMKQCNFGAIYYSSSLGKCKIDPVRCWGCGICRNACDKGAISLKDRNKVEGLKNNWS